MPDISHTPTRSWLFTPAIRPERFIKAVESAADISIIDLEDSVTPNDKAQARKNCDAVPFIPTKLIAENSIKN